jgi:radical SAM superfamily enzyme YgiQ (UPF0313 family)
MADIVIINPRFEVSMYGLEHAMPFFRAKAASPVASLPLLAALTPANHNVTLIDENVEPIDFERCARADIVGVTGMIVQHARMGEILFELKRRGVFVVLGGPLVTVVEEYFAGRADVVFIGEAEETWPRFLAEWAEGRHQPRYEQAEKTDLTTVPVPRYDLLEMRRYAHATVQFSRGCPFQCEFCDIIVVFGRRPRIKTVPQVLAELDALRAEGVENVLIVDDNLIANRKAIKEVLRAVAAWQEQNGFPFSFQCEASLDLADEAETMRLMVAANIGLVFVGIESPNEDSLRETKKLQNLRKGGTMVDKVHAVQRAGIEVFCGMILGFDHDDAGIFEAHRRFIAEAQIVNSLINLLVAIPGTPLFARLQREGRLDSKGTYGTNVIPRRMSGAALRHGAFALAREIYRASNYFDRLDALYLDSELATEPARKDYLARHPLRWLKANALYLIQSGVILVSLMQAVDEAGLAREYLSRMWRALKRKRDPIMLRIYAIKCAIHYHMHLMARQNEHLVGYDLSGLFTPVPTAPDGIDDAGGSTIAREDVLAGPGHEAEPHRS